MTERTPPGRASLAKVTINCTARRSKSRIVESGYQGYRSAQACPYTGSQAMIGEFAPHMIKDRSNYPESDVVDIPEMVDRERFGTPQLLGLLDRGSDSCVRTSGMGKLYSGSASSNVRSTAVNEVTFVVATS